MNGNVLVSDDAIPPVQNGYWLVVLPSKRQPPVRNRLADGAYIGYQGKWVPQPNTIITITINQGSTSVAILREDDTLIANVSEPTYKVPNGRVNQSDGTFIGEILADGDFDVDNSEITVQYESGAPIAEVSVKATDPALVLVPDPPVCSTLDELVASSSDAEVITAVDLANKEDAVFEGIAPLVLDATVEDSLSLAQRNVLSRVSFFKIGTPVIYDANDIGSNDPGRGDGFFTLSENNPNGNTNRFELLGTAVVIDWANRIYWTKDIQSPARTTWALHNSNSLALTLEGLTGWRLPSIIEVNSILQQFSGDPLNYSPFNILFGVTAGASFNFATGHTSLFSTANCVVYALTSASRGIGWNYTSNNKVTNTTVALYCKSF